MLRTCLLMLLFYAALVAGYHWWLAQQFDPPGVWIGAAVVALIVAGCIGSLINSVMSYREWSLLSAARHDLPWSDGRWTAVAGEIHPVQESLTAPFSGAECVMCEYDVASQHRIAASSRNENSTPGSDFTGFLMNPCVVRTRMGDVRLLGFPNLVGFGERVCDGYTCARNAREFLTTNEFEDYSGIKMVSILSALKDAWNDDDGLVRKNLRLAKITPQSLFPADLERDIAALPLGSVPSEAEALDEDELDEPATDDEVDDDADEVADYEGPTSTSAIPLLKEKRVKAGDTVCAIGIYSSEKRGLVPGGLGADHFIKLIRGRIADVERQARNSTFGRLFGGLIGLLVVNAAAYGVMMANRYHPSTRGPRENQAFQMVQKGDVAKLAKLIQRGVDINVRDSNGRTLLWHAEKPDVARWLIEHGADVNVASGDGLTPLQKAIRENDEEIIKLLRQAKAKE
jgi:hypothetical protein